jgi:hypothetical protein
VSYVVVGRLEQRAYPAAHLARLAKLPWLHVAYETGATRVYEVDRREMDSGVPSR